MGFLRRTRRKLNVLLGRDLYIRPNYDCNKIRLGSEMAGWFINPDNLDENSIVYSAGVGTDISFDLELINRFSSKVFAFDPTPKSVDWIKKQELPDKFILKKIGISDFNGEINFASPENSEYVSYRKTDKNLLKNAVIELPVKSIKTIMIELGHDKIDILKMDIEGAEYDVIDDICISSFRPSQILVEFHHRFNSYSVWDTKKTIEKIFGMNYKLFAVSENGQEYSFIYIN